MMTNLLSEMAGEPRMRDLDLADRLQFSDPHKIRDLICRHERALKRFGEVSATVAETTAMGGRPGRSYWLNRKQVLYLCAKSETPRAAEVTIAMVELFDAWLEGKTVPVREHMRRPPAPAVRLEPVVDLPEHPFHVHKGHRPYSFGVAPVPGYGSEVISLGEDTVLQFSCIVEQRFAWRLMDYMGRKMIQWDRRLKARDEYARQVGRLPANP